MTRAPCRVLRGVGYRPITSVSGHGSAAGAGRSCPPGSRRRKRGAPSNTLSRSTGHRPPFLVSAALPPDRTRPDAFDPRPGRRRTLPPAGPVSTVERRSLSSRKQLGDPAVCLTLANAAFVLDHVNSVRPARSFTRTLHHAGHLSPGDLWRALDGEYPRTAILVRRHHDVITLTDQYGDTFAYPTAAAIPTAVPDALGSAGGGRAASPPGSRTPRSVLRVAGR